MTTLKEIITSKRPNITESSIKTYLSTIKSLYKKMTNEPIKEEEEVYTYFKNNSSKVLEHLKSMEGSKRKSILASLVALCTKDKCQDVYKNQMLKDAIQYNQDQKDQTKSDKEQKSWISQEDVMKVYRRLSRSYTKYLIMDKLTNHQLQNLQDLVIMSLYVLIPPRRLMDYTEFKLKNVDKSKDNYMEGNKFYFNIYKTAKKYNLQEVDIPIKLRNLILKWGKKTDNEYLLFDDNGKKLTPSQLTIRLNGIFGGRKISVNQLRHTYITDNVLKDVPALKHLQEIATDMGHSIDQQLLYKKIS